MKTTTKKPIKRVTKSTAKKATTQRKATPAKKAVPAKKASKKTEVSNEEGFRKLFEDELKDIYWAEKALTKAIPKMIKNATSEQLADALRSHLEETNGHVERLEKVFASIGVKAVAKKCEAMDGLIKEASEIMEETEDGAIRDAGIISAGQKVEHYEIATYGTLIAFAKVLGEDEAVSLLVETLNEEKQADETLSEISDKVNAEAFSDSDNSEDSDDEEEYDDDEEESDDDDESDDEESDDEEEEEEE